MKILHIIPAIAFRYGGPSKAVINICGVLKKNNIECDIATTNADGKGSLDIELGKIVNYQNISTIFFSRNFSEAFKYSSSLAKWLERNIVNYDLAHIHAVFSHSTIAASKSCIKNKVPYIIRPLGSLDPWSLKQKRILKTILWKIFIKKLFDESSGIHYTTNSEMDLANKFYNENGKGFVIPLGVDRDLNNHKTDNSFSDKYSFLKDNPYILILSRIHKKKGLELFIECFMNIVSRSEYKNWKLVIAGDGDGDYIKKIHKIISDLLANDKIYMTGWVNNSEKYFLLENSNLLAMPSHQENFGLSLIEAMSLGIPVLISEFVNTAKDIKEANAGWIVGLNRVAIENKLIEVFDNEKERLKRGRNGINLVNSKYNWSNIGKELIEIYKSIISNS